jgi:hypothetical protein
MRLLSDAKVARRWESWGEAASRSKGGAGAIVDAGSREGDAEFGEFAGK